MVLRQYLELKSRSWEWHELDLCFIKKKFYNKKKKLNSNWDFTNKAFWTLTCKPIIYI